MKKLLLFIGIIYGIFLTAQDRMLEADSNVITDHEVTIKGQRVPYRAICGTQPVWNDEGKVIASLHFTYYERKDVQDRSRRPLVISFNGGPGSASVWMHLAYTGPYVLLIDEEGYPIQPYGVKENEHSILDVADIVYVNPVNTGYSRILDKEVEKKTFFGVKADIKYLAEWLNTFVSRQNRWRSPKYLIGESYGTTRVSGLALELQNAQWMYLNGVILVSPTGLGIDRDGPVGVANRLPYFTAAAWYHNKLPADLQAMDLDDVLDESEAYTLNTLIPVIAKGGFVSDAEREQAAQMMARYSGISEKIILQHNLDVSNSFFWKELLRDEGYTIGRLDSRYKGIDKMDGGERPDFNSELTSWLHSFTPAINYYMRNIMKYQTDIKYNMFGPVRPWDRSGHMMYLRAEDLKGANEHIREFITSTDSKGRAAKY